MPTTSVTDYGKCGECLMNDVEIVQLGPDGKCPRCGVNYGAAVGNETMPQVKARRSKSSKAVTRTA